MPPPARRGTRPPSKSRSAASNLRRMPRSRSRSPAARFASSLPAGRCRAPRLPRSNPGKNSRSGRALAAGDVLPLAEPRTLEPKLATLDAHWLARAGTTIRVVLGPQDDYFTEAVIAAFLAGPWTLSARSDRMAYLLEGERLAHAKGFNIVSDGIAFGAIQVPGDGQPVVLMADRQPTGGYPKIANVIGADLGKIAQLRPGTQISFAAVTIEEAVAARRAEALALERPIPREPLMRTEFPSEFLLGLNLVDGVIADDAADEG